MTKVPAPPDLSVLLGARLAEQPYVLAPGTRLHRVHESRFAPDSCNTGGCGRFHPFADAAGNPVPCLYAADSVVGSYTETVFHAVGEQSCQQAPAKRLHRFSHSLLAAGKELRLAHLGGDMLARLRLTRAALLEPGPARYADTVR
jgi:hypothetical protein